MEKMINQQSKEYTIAYKNRMYEIKLEMEHIKELASEEAIKARKEKRMQEMEKERDWFRTEAINLNKMNHENKREIDKLKLQLSNIVEERQFFQTELYKAKKVNKALIIELEHVRQEGLQVET